MIKHALFVRLEAKSGKEKELAQFLQAGLSLAQQEGTTPVEPDRRPILEMLIASIDLSEVTFNQ